MLRPGGGSGEGTRRGALLLRALPLAVAVSASLTVAHAAPQVAALSLSAKRPAVAAATESAPQALAGERKLAGTFEEPFGPEQRAQELYLDGMEKLEAGRRAWAKTTFEDLIARFPDSTAAALARRQLGTLNRSGTAQAATVPGARVETAAAPAGVAAAIGASPLWDQELRRNASIQAKLRSEAGDRVFFSAGSAELGSRARVALSAQAQWLIRWHEFEAAIEGHADDPATEDENRKLSEARAEAVRRRLVDEGVEASRLTVVAQGRTRRVATCAEPACAAQNRRVVTLVFASGTRERLGLTALPVAAVMDQPAAQSLSPATSEQTPVPVEPVGVAR